MKWVMEGVSVERGAAVEIPIGTWVDDPLLTPTEGAE